jgi:hypothetical protein
MTATFNRNALAKGGYRGALRESCRITMPAHAPQGLIKTETWDLLKSVETGGSIVTATIGQPIVLNLSLVAQNQASQLGRRVGTTINNTWYMTVPSTVDFTVSNAADTFSYTIEGTDPFGDPITENGAKTSTTTSVCRSIFVFQTITRITATPTVATGGTNTATLSVGRDMINAPVGQRFHLPFKLDSASYIVGLQLIEVPVGWTADLSMSVSRLSSTATTTVGATSVADGGATPWGGVTLDSSFVGQYLYTASVYGVITAVTAGTNTITVGGGWISRADPNSTASTPANNTVFNVTYTYQQAVRGVQGDATQPQNGDTAIANNNPFGITPNMLARSGVGAFISSQLFTAAGATGSPEARWVITPGGFLDR